MKLKYTKTGRALYNEIEDRNSAAKIAQLRTGHCVLNDVSIASAKRIHHIANADMEKNQWIRMQRLWGDPKLIKHRWNTSRLQAD
jgi:hypothetical protein